jgi:transcriptional regulator with XRE-family HTH domain
MAAYSWSIFASVKSDFASPVERFRVFISSSTANAVRLRGLPATRGGHMGRQKSRTEEAAATRAQVREWLQALMARHKVKPIDIHRDTGVNTATIYRLLREQNDPGMDTIMRIAERYGAPPPGAGAPGHLAESEAAPWEGPPPAGEGETLLANQSWWRIGSRALELAGVLPGDFALLDQTAPARAGDIVIAQIYDFERGSAETKVRFFDGIYLQTRTMDHSVDERPIMVDGERAAIAGRIVRLTRSME